MIEIIFYIHPYDLKFNVLSSNLVDPIYTLSSLNKKKRIVLNKIIDSYFEKNEIQIVNQHSLKKNNLDIKLNAKASHFRRNIIMWAYINYWPYDYV